MCGIVGYIGDKNAFDITIEGLKKLEYRGYDSAGVALLSSKGIEVHKKKGRVGELEQYVRNKKSPEQKIAISHTRWATHGVPSDKNSHPHFDQKKDFALVHNGIIENYKELKDMLIKKGYKFNSDTDTEVLAHLLRHLYQSDKSIKFNALVAKALEQVEGTYGLAIVSQYYPDELIAARKGSPVVIGLGEKEYFIASDPLPIVEYTRRLIYLDDGDIIHFVNGDFEITALDNKSVKRKIQEASHDLESVTKEGYKHFMLKEIFEQPESFKNSTRGRIKVEDGEIKLGGLIDHENYLTNLKQLNILACGTSYYAGIYGQFIFEKLSRVKATAEIASEFRYRDPVIENGSVYLALSQSGETADTLEALRLTREYNCLNLGITNVVGSTLARETDAGVYMHIGPEIGVAASKSFLAQLTIITMMAIKIASLKGKIKNGELRELLEDFVKVPSGIEKVLKSSAEIRKIAKKYQKSRGFYFLGRGLNYPIALEGALKMKELAYNHAEGYPSGEMKHGPIALLDKDFTVVVIAPSDSYFDKNIGSMQEIKARQGKIILITDSSSQKALELADDVIKVPKLNSFVQPLLNLIPMQLFAYHFADLLGRDIDMPRNLAKSVTVE